MPISTAFNSSQHCAEGHSKIRQEDKMKGIKEAKLSLLIDSKTMYIRNLKQSIIKGGRIKEG
jgi:hypothetical protein